MAQWREMELSEEAQLRSVGWQTSQSILSIRQRAEQELLLAKQALEERTAELARSLALMRATLDATADGIFAVDNDGTPIDYNEQFLQMWNFPRDAIEHGDREALRELACEQLKN